MDGRRNRMTAVDNGRVVSLEQNEEDCGGLPLCGRAPEVTSCMLRDCLNIEEICFRTEEFSLSNNVLVRRSSRCLLSDC